jgi:hypothetical protein
VDLGNVSLERFGENDTGDVVVALIRVRRGVYGADKGRGLLEKTMKK